MPFHADFFPPGVQPDQPSIFPVMTPGAPTGGPGIGTGNPLGGAANPAPSGAGDDFMTVAEQAAALEEAARNAPVTLNAAEVLNAAAFLLSDFYSRGFSDPFSEEQTRAYRALVDAENAADSSSSGPLPRTQSQIDLDIANAGLADANASLLEETEKNQAGIRELNRQNAAQLAFQRAEAALDLQQEAQRLADARRQIAVDALLRAQPYIVDPNIQYNPGFEPFGPAQAAATSLGAGNVTTPATTFQLPLNDILNSPSVTPGQISADLDPLLRAPGDPQ